MAERSTLRGSRLVSTSYEDERGIDFADRQLVSYDCPRGHHFEMTFAVDAEIPPLWDCPRCGAEALKVASDRPDDKPSKPARTHWDMLLERRSIDELEGLLDERLEMLRANQAPDDERQETKPRNRKKTA